MNPKLTADIFFPMIREWSSLSNQNLSTFPNFPSPLPINHSYLSLPFYQSLADVATNPHFAGEIAGIKMIDIVSGRDHLKDVSMNSISTFLESLARPLSIEDDRTFHDTLYDPKYYPSTSQWVLCVARLHREYPECASLESFQRTVSQHSWLVDKPELSIILKDTLIPMMKEHILTHGDIHGFPDIALPDLAHDRSSAVYQALAACGSDPYFSWRVHALKVIDEAHGEGKRVMQCLSLEDIKALHSMVIGVSSGPNRCVTIMDTVYTPRYYSDLETFKEFVIELHHQFVLEANCSRLITKQRVLRKNKLGVRWYVAVQLWFNEAIQLPLRMEIGNEAIEQINQILNPLLNDSRVHLHNNRNSKSKRPMNAWS